MSFFKILGGVVLGVGAVAAAPFTGGGSVLGAATLLGSLAGAGTVAAAVGAGAAGAAAGYAIGKGEEEDHKAEIAQARAEERKALDILGKMKQAGKEQWLEQELEAMRDEFQRMRERTAEWGDYAKKVVAMFGVGLAVAYVDGHLAQEEQKAIQEFVFGASKSALPPSARRAINALQAKPPSFTKAVQMAQKAGVRRDVVDAIIELVASADQKYVAQEEQLVLQWKNMTYLVN